MNRCAWCKHLLGDPSDIISVAIDPQEAIPYESAQDIDRIIFLSLEEEPFAIAICKEEDPWIGDKKAIPVFVVPFGENGENFVAKTCSRECAEKLRNAVENEEFTFRWNFE